MPEQFASSFPYILLATGAGILGSLISMFWSPTVRVRSAVQHFAAGAVLAAVAANVVPQLEQLGTLPGIVGGFIAAGIALLSLIGSLSAGFLLADVAETALAIVLVFGAAALIYLIAEELSVENVQAEESLSSTVTLFAGFLGLLVLKLLE
jgi:ZIP family zinc transporter